MSTITWSRTPRGPWGLLLAISLVVLAALSTISLTSCAAAEKHTASTNITSAGSLVNELRASNLAVFSHNTNELIEGGLRGEAYLEAAAPMEAEMRERLDALGLASGGLYGVAQALDETQDPHSVRVQMAARDAERWLLHAVDVLRDGHALDPVPIPARVRVELDRLHALGRGVVVMDAGTVPGEDGGVRDGT